MQIRLMKQTCIYMYPHSKILLETPPLLCLMRKLGIYRHPSYNIMFLTHIYNYVASRACVGAPGTPDRAPHSPIAAADR